MSQDDFDYDSMIIVEDLIKKLKPGDETSFLNKIRVLRYTTNKQLFLVSYNKSGNKNVGHLNTFHKHLTFGMAVIITYNLIIEERNQQASYKNTGQNNEGRQNSGDNNSGHKNTGNHNIGVRNSGHYNNGDLNAGNKNNGHRNVGNNNDGDGNTGHGNIGSYNTGKCNNGDFNTGGYNMGEWNTGEMNEGSYNRGSWNKGNHNFGYFNTSKKKFILLFDKPYIGSFKTIKLPMFFYDVTSEWTHNNLKAVPKNLDFKEMWKQAWEKAPLKEKKEVLDIPNFNNDIFKDITGINAYQELGVEESPFDNERNIILMPEE